LPDGCLPCAIKDLTNQAVSSTMVLGRREGSHGLTIPAYRPSGEPMSKPRNCVRCQLPIESKTYYEGNNWNTPVHKDCRLTVNEPFRNKTGSVPASPSSPGYEVTDGDTGG